MAVVRNEHFITLVKGGFFYNVNIPLLNSIKKIADAIR